MTTITTANIVVNCACVFSFFCTLKREYFVWIQLGFVLFYKAVVPASMFSAWTESQKWEKVMCFQAYVRALDSGNPPLTDEAVVRIIVNGNQNRPVFTSTTATFNINEDAGPGSIVGSCTATDADSLLPGSNVRVQICAEFVSLQSLPSFSFPTSDAHNLSLVGDK